MFQNERKGLIAQNATYTTARYGKCIYFSAHVCLFLDGADVLLTSRVIITIERKNVNTR